MRRQPAVWRIRRLNANDAEGLSAFYDGLSAEAKRLFRPLGFDPALAQFEAVVKDNHSKRRCKYDLVAIEGSEIVGWSFAWNLDGQKPVFGLAVADAWHGRGVGTALMDAVIEFCKASGVKKLYLTVVIDNALAPWMYTRRGFVAYKRAASPQDGQTYLHMVKTFGEE